MNKAWAIPVGLALWAAVLACNFAGRALEKVTAIRAPGSAERVDPAAAFDPAAEPDPLSVEVELDEAAGVQKTISGEGGTVEANLGSGVAVSLEVPRGAVAGPAEIGLTPVREIQGLPFSGGLGAAVDLSPDGAVLAQPATLTLELPPDAPLEELVAFSYRGDGEAFILHPWQLEEGSRVTIPVFHFSGVGVGRGTVEDMQAQLDRTPVECSDHAAQADAGRRRGAGRRDGQR